jgi:hypothetical protein
MNIPVSRWWYSQWRRSFALCRFSSWVIAGNARG